MQHLLTRMRHQIVEAATANGALVLRVRALPLPAAAAAALDAAADQLSALLLSRGDPHPDPNPSHAAAADAHQAEPRPALDSANGTIRECATGSGAPLSAAPARQAAACGDAARAESCTGSGHTADGDAQPAAALRAGADHSTPSAGTVPETSGQGGAQGGVGDGRTGDGAADPAANPTLGSIAAPTGLATLRARLTAAFEGGTGGEAGEGQDLGHEAGSALLRRAWQLGPRRVGPNVLLLPPRTGAPGLWDVPASAVLASGKRAGVPQGLPAAAPAGADAAASGGAGHHGAAETGNEESPPEQVRSTAVLSVPAAYCWSSSVLLMNNLQVPIRACALPSQHWPCSC